MYRAVTWAAIQRDIPLDGNGAVSSLASALDVQLIPSEAGDRLFLDGEDITDHLRDPDVERGVSLVAKVPGVRRAMVSQQRSIASEGPVVMVGRDIGTVVLKDAAVKIFLNASVDVRARRRYKELKREGQRPEYRKLVDELARRDKIDSERDDSPLRPADDSIQVDTDNLEVDQVAQQILAIVEQN